MNWIRDFTRRHMQLPERTIDNDAPRQMRGELVDFFFYLAEESEGLVQPNRIYEITGLLTGAGLTANPYGGYQTRVARDIGATDWWTVYDWISRLWAEFERAHLEPRYREGVNAILAAHGVVWELDEWGHLQRVMATPLRQQIASSIAQLAREEFSNARTLFENATDAFNARPRRDRDACSNAYDALESVAKVTYAMPNATFGQVLTELRRRDALNEYIVRLLRDIETLRHNTFGHGEAEGFALRGPEVDFVYTACAAGILLFTQ